MPISEAEKLIRAMKRDHAKLLKQYDDAITKATPGTGVHTRLLEAKDKAKERFRAELVQFGVIPKDLQSQTKTKYTHISLMPQTPANDAELKALLEKQMVNYCKGMNVDHEKVCAMFEAAFPVGSGVNKESKPDEEALEALEAHVSSAEYRAKQTAYDGLIAEIEKGIEQ